MVCPKCGSKQARMENPVRYICLREHEHARMTGRPGRSVQSTFKPWKRREKAA